MGRHGGEATGRVDDDDDDLVEITAVKFLGMPNEAFLWKDMDNNKKKDEE